MEDKRIAWAITGAGHSLSECVEILMMCRHADLFLSRAGEEVLQMYDLYSRVQASGLRIYRDDAASTPLAACMYSGIYEVLVVAPATSNSVAKFVRGVSDNLVTNLFAQAGKSRVPVIVYPTDLAPEVRSSGPHGEVIRVYPRPKDLENTEALRGFTGTRVVDTREELIRCLAAYL